jgi:hypothetical protein
MNKQPSMWEPAPALHYFFKFGDCFVKARLHSTPLDTTRPPARDDTIGKGLRQLQSPEWRLSAMREECLCGIQYFPDIPL